MKTAHTPGPWDLSRYHFPHRQIVRRAGSEDNDSRPFPRLICNVVEDGKSEEEYKANARLIAAAPDLLFELQQAVKVIEALHGEAAWDIFYNNAPEMKRIRAAIAKAQEDSK